MISYKSLTHIGLDLGCIWGTGSIVNLFSGLVLNGPNVGPCMLSGLEWQNANREIYFANELGQGLTFGPLGWGLSLPLGLITGCVWTSFAYEQVYSLQKVGLRWSTLHHRKWVVLCSQACPCSAQLVTKLMDLVGLTWHVCKWVHPQVDVPHSFSLLGCFLLCFDLVPKEELSIILESKVETIIPCFWVSRQASLYLWL